MEWNSTAVLEDKNSESMEFVTWLKQILQETKYADYLALSLFPHQGELRVQIKRGYDNEHD